MPFSPGARVTVVHAKPWRLSRPIRMRTTVREYRDGLLTLERTFAAGGRYDSLGDARLAGDHGTIEVEEGSWVLRRTYRRADDVLIGELFNIQTPAEFRADEVRYVDLEVDVLRRADGRVSVVDEDDLRAAVAMGGITPKLADDALAVARALADVLSRGGDWRAISAPARSGPPDVRWP